MKDNFVGEEKRNAKRIKVDFTIVYKVDSPMEVTMSVGWNTEVSAMVLDLSISGMGIQTIYDIPVATIISMKFTLIDLAVRGSDKVKSMDISGEVRSNIKLENGEHRLGISFTWIKKEDQEAIAEFISNKNLFPA